MTIGAIANYEKIEKGFEKFLMSAPRSKQPVRQPY